MAALITDAGGGGNNTTAKLHCLLGGCVLLCASCDVCPERTADDACIALIVMTVDESDFVEFELKRSTGVLPDFCILPGDIVTASITRNDTGIYGAAISVAVANEDGTVGLREISRDLDLMGIGDVRAAFSRR